MLRRIIEINEELCNGCGACAAACHEGAISMVDGKAKLMRDDYCDGLGDCLPTCPTGAIKFVEREAAEYDEAAVKENMKKNGRVHGGGCPGSMAKAIHREEEKPAGMGCPGTQSRMIQREQVGNAGAADSCASGTCAPQDTANAPQLAYQAPVSRLSQWPVQIKLAPIKSAYFDNANLLIAADCTAYAYADFHNQFIRNRITLIGCPKLDSVDYSEKLTEIIKNNEIKSVTIVRMEVPCCGGIEHAVKTALQNSGKFLPWQVVTISTDGRILE